MGFAISYLVFNASPDFSLTIVESFENSNLLHYALHLYEKRSQPNPVAGDGMSQPHQVPLFRLHLHQPKHLSHSGYWVLRVGFSRTSPPHVAIATPFGSPRKLL